MSKKEKQQAVEKIIEMQNMSPKEVANAIREAPDTVVAMKAIASYIFKAFHLPEIEKLAGRKIDPQTAANMENIFLTGYYHGMKHQENVEVFLDAADEKPASEVSEPQA